MLNLSRERPTKNTLGKVQGSLTDRFHKTWRWGSSVVHGWSAGRVDVLAVNLTSLTSVSLTSDNLTWEKLLISRNNLLVQRGSWRISGSKLRIFWLISRKSLANRWIYELCLIVVLVSWADLNCCCCYWWPGSCGRCSYCSSRCCSCCCSSSSGCSCCCRCFGNIIDF